MSQNGKTALFLLLLLTSSLLSFSLSFFLIWYYKSIKALESLFGLERNKFLRHSLSLFREGFFCINFLDIPRRNIFYLWRKSVCNQLLSRWIIERTTSLFRFRVPLKWQLWLCQARSSVAGYWFDRQYSWTIEGLKCVPLQLVSLDHQLLIATLLEHCWNSVGTVSFGGGNSTFLFILCSL